jgi:hypothetical protein
MAIIKAKIDKEYVQIPNKLLHDPRLSFESKGVLCLLLSLPEDWSVNKEWIIKQSSAGRDKITRILGELQKANYLLRQTAHDKQGRITGVDWLVYPYDVQEKLASKAVELETLTTGLTDEDKPTTTKEISLTKKDNTNTVQPVEQIAPLKTQECEEMAFDLIWTNWPVKQNKKKARESFNKICKKLKTDEAIKNEVAMMLNYQQMALARLRATNGGEYIGFDKLHMTTFLNQQRYKDLTADEVLEILAGCE